MAIGAFNLECDAVDPDQHLLQLFIRFLKVYLLGQFNLVELARNGILHPSLTVWPSSLRLIVMAYLGMSARTAKAIGDQNHRLHGGLLHAHIVACEQKCTTS